jgi:hypothetical protein
MPHVRAVVPWIAGVRLKNQTFVFLIGFSLLYLIFLLVLKWLSLCLCFLDGVVAFGHAMHGIFLDRLFQFLNGAIWKCLLLTFSNMLELFCGQSKNDTVTGLFHWSSWLVDAAEAWTILSFRWNSPLCCFLFYTQKSL